MEQVKKRPLHFIGTLVALGVLFWTLREGNIGNIPFALAVTAIGVVNTFINWLGPKKGIFAVWTIALAATATDFLTIKSMGFLFWCAGVPLFFYGLADLIAWRTHKEG